MHPPITPHSFQTTRWSLVEKATSPDDTIARTALASLCEAYWYPIYAYVRRTGRSPPDAEDLTQGFFACLLARDMLARADASKGKLRTFLLTCARRYVSDEQDRAMAQKRGGRLLTSFDAALEMPLGTIKNHVFRLRERWRELIFEEVAATLTNASPEEIKGELAELLGGV